MVNIGSAKALFDYDLIAGFIVAELLMYIIYKITAPNLPILQQQIVPWVNYGMILNYAILIVAAVALKGRMKKIMIYALWFNLAIDIHRILWASI